MRESRTYGSVRGALSNERPYRVQSFLLRCMSPQMAQAVWKGGGMSTIVSGTLASAIVEYRSEQNRLPDRSRRSLGRLLALI